MDINSLTLSFRNRALEKEYRLKYDIDNRNFTRLGCILSAFVWILCTSSTYILFPHFFPLIVFIALAIITPIITAVTALTFFKQYARLLPWGMGLANSAAAFAILYISFVAYYNQVLLSGGIIITSLYAFFIFRIRFFICVFFTTAYLAVCQLLMIKAGLPFVDLFINSSTIWAAQTAFMAGSYFMEKTSRSLFISTKLLFERNLEIENDLVIARMIVENLLPKDISSIPGCTAHTCYIPMDKVGGDFYDIRHDKGIIRLFIADVSGHGLASSYLALITRMSLDSIDSDLSPSCVFEKLNDMICDSTVNYNFVTAFLARLDLASGVLSFSSAGHPPAFLFRPSSGEIINLKTAGKALGWFKSKKFAEGSIQIESGDRIVLYTDGITECDDKSGKMYGDDRFKDFILGTLADKSTDFTEKLLDELHLFNGKTPFNDDITLLVIDII